MRLANFKYKDQTQILGEYTKSKNYGMMLITNGIKIMMCTTHMSLNKAIKKIKYRLVLNKIVLAYDALKLFNLDNPVIGVTGVNPHAGEGGIFGEEEIKYIFPAIEKAQKLGINAMGPFPFGTVYQQSIKHNFDLIPKYKNLDRKKYK